MLIGILSDSHDDMQQIAKVVDLFNDRGVQEVIHAGDMVSPFTFEIFDDLKGNFRAIFGNNDGDRLLLKQKSAGRVFVQPLLADIGGLRFAVVHEPTAADALAGSGKFDVVVYGHSHEPDVRKVGDALVINPGKVAKLHKGKSTAAILDTKTLKAEIVEI